MLTIAVVYNHVCFGFSYIHILNVPRKHSVLVKTYTPTMFRKSSFGDNMGRSTYHWPQLVVVILIDAKKNTWNVVWHIVNDIH